jgi:hypothetical protein
MKSLVPAGATTSAIGTDCFADELDRDVGPRASSECEIVACNPVVIGDNWLEDRPARRRTLHGSLNDARLARPTIGAGPQRRPAGRLTSG